jgi:hypothetical protein
MPCSPALFVVVALTSACAGAPPPREPAPTPTVVTANVEKKSAATRALDAAEQAVRAKDYTTASRKIDEAKRMPQVSSGELGRAAFLEAATHAYRGDYEATARALLKHLEYAAPRRDEPTAFYLHNSLSIVRQAQGDLTAALIEADARTRTGELGTWTGDSSPGSDRATQVKLKETWHRAYLLRMYVQQVAGTRRDAALAEAEEARRQYTAIAQPLGTYSDSIAVLEAFFAMHDGDHARAREAARRVDVTKNDDVEDLYLVYSALDAAGDKEGAAATKKAIDAVTYVSFIVPIIREFIDRDGRSGTKRFTPRQPTGQL